MSRRYISTGFRQDMELLFSKFIDNSIDLYIVGFYKVVNGFF